jgi:hypothetical protein
VYRAARVLLLVVGARAPLLLGREPGALAPAPAAAPVAAAAALPARPALELRLPASTCAAAKGVQESGRAQASGRSNDQSLSMPAFTNDRRKQRC